MDQSQHSSRPRTYSMTLQSMGNCYLQIQENDFDSSANYAEECKKLIAQNDELTLLISSLSKERDAITNKIKTLKDIKKKPKSGAGRHRRAANEIVRFYKCPHCNKQYGSECSLKFHMKLKHGDAPQEDLTENSQENQN